MSVFDSFLYKIIDRRIALYQNDLIEKHYQEVQNIYTTMREWRHDYHNHIQTMLALVDQPDRIREYLLKINNDLAAIDTVIKTGNVMLDAILNSKISLIKTYDIYVSAKAAAPKEFCIADIDMCTIIGNLLDNALESCLRQDPNSDRFIRIYIDILKKQLYISVQNSAGQIIKKTGNKYVSTKNSTHSGIGLKRIDRIVNKYNGYINRQSENEVFATEVMLPI